MLFNDSYFSIEEPSQGIYKDKGSKFLAYLFPVQDEEDIKQHLQALRREHPSARHHCYAWELGVSARAWRANDDGEPSSTAGKPILAQIRARQLTNVLLVVVRYFGGTLLGVNGLIQAYRGAAADAIQNSEVKEYFIQYRYSVRFDASDSSPVMRILKEFESSFLSDTYDDKRVITFDVKKQLADQMEQRFKDLYATELKLLKTD